MLSRDEISRLKAEVNLISYLEAMGLKPSWRRNGSAMFFSPLRTEKNPSFYVSCRKGSWMWKDWGTGDSGDIIEFLQLLYGIDFPEAVKRLAHEHPSLPVNPSQPEKKDPIDPAWVKEFYSRRRKSAYQTEWAIKEYFLCRGVNYYPQMGCVYCRLKEHEKEYVGIPIPFPQKIRGIEWREVEGRSRKTWGKKTLWVLKRNLQRILVSESILDALAGEKVLRDTKLTLCSVNGVTNVTHLETLFELYKPEEVIFALDADEPGRIATGAALEIAERLSIPRVIDYEEHIQEGVKDLHQLLQKKGGHKNDSGTV